MAKYDPALREYVVSYVPRHDGELCIHIDRSGTWYESDYHVGELTLDRGEAIELFKILKEMFGRDNGNV